MKTTAGRIGPVVAVLALATGPAGGARGEWVEFDFTAVDAAGRVLEGAFGYDAATPPSYEHVYGPDLAVAEFLSWSRWPMEIIVFLDGRRDGLAVPADGVYPAVSIEPVVGNSAPGYESDVFGFVVTNYRDGFYDHHELILGDEDGTAFDTHLSLPTAFDLAAFERREFRYFTEDISFFGTIVSLGPGTGGAGFVPEPSTLALCGPAALLGLAGGWWVRWRKHWAA